MGDCWAFHAIRQPLWKGEKRQQCINGRSSTKGQLGTEDISKSNTWEEMNAPKEKFEHGFLMERWEDKRSEC